MYAKPEHVHHGRMLYVVNAFPSSLPGMTQCSITTVKVLDAPRILWQGNYFIPLNANARTRLVSKSRRPTYRYRVMEKPDRPNAKFTLGHRFLSTDNIGPIRKNSCRLTFLKLKDAEAYQARIMAEQFNSRELAYIAWNDATSSVIGCKNGLQLPAWY